MPCGVIYIPTIPPPNNVIVIYPYVNIVPGDFDGDGNADLFYYNREGEKKIYLSNGDGTFTEQSAITSLGGNIWGGNPTLIDFDGDGDMDFLASKTTPFNPQPGQQEPTVTILGWYLYESNGNGTFTNRGVINFGATGSQQASFQPVDFNGDGKTDLAVRFYDGQNLSGYHAFRSNGTGSFINQGLGVFISPGTEIKSWGDFNGDGLSDALVSTNSFNHTIYFSKGDFSFDAVTVSNSNFFNLAGNEVYSGDIHTGDFNGDGLTDLMPVIRNNVFPPTSMELRLFLSDGDGTFTYVSSSDLPIYNFDASAPFSNAQEYNEWVNEYSKTRRGMVGDFNGDGRSDFLGVNLSDKMEIISFADDTNVTDLAPLPDMLKKVVNGKGGSTTFDYEPSSEYEKDFDDKMPFIMQMVSSINLNDGNGGSYTTSYDYYGADFVYGKKEFLGFKNIYKTSPDGSYEATEYFQGHYTKHRPYKAKFYQTQGGAILTETEYNWGTYPSSPTTWAFVKLNWKKTIYDGNLSYYTREAYTYYDSTNRLPENIYKTGTNANGSTIEQITQYYQYTECTSQSNIWRVALERVTGATTGLARKMTYGYDSNGNMTSKTFWKTETTYYSPAITYGYDDEYGNMTSETDGLSHTTSIEYDTATKTYPWLITDAKGYVTTKLWNYKFGKEEKITDINNNKTLFTYDFFGRADTITNKNSAETVVVGLTQVHDNKNNT